MDSERGDIEDLSTIADLDEDILLREISSRYLQDKIYTYVGDILIAVNPFKDIDIYGPHYSQMYKNIPQCSRPSHIYAVADAAYQALTGHNGKHPGNQCVIISGESGAGKTESTKLLIKQIVELCKGNTQLEQQILKVSPLLEAFGNAQTNLNDNSSRFGKYIQLKFNDGHLVGGKISEYLLEKSRLVGQGAGEQNFHIFYYLFGSDIHRKYLLSGPRHYKYLNSSKTTDLKSIHEQFETVTSAMDSVGFTDDEQENVFSIIASILHLGNITFTVQEDESVTVTEKTESSLTAARFLEVDSEDLKESLCYTFIQTKREKLRRNYTKEMAEDARDAMSKALYGRLFGWIVNKINCLLVPENQAANLEIGILDIFGFEDFTKDGGHNSFEQFCINLANEQLQYFFNRHVFFLEQEEYKKEEIDWTEIKFVDNKPLLDLFLGKPIGILSILDEENRFPGGTDQSFVNKLTQVMEGNENFIKSQQTNKPVFSINHYAGNVVYTCTNWLEKNRDTLPEDITTLLRSSSNFLIKTIFKAFISRTGSLALQGRYSRNHKVFQQTPIAMDTTANKLTVGTQFKNSLNILMERMTASSPIFIRCFKPNHEKLPERLEPEYLRNQLLYTGMLQTIEIRRRGFAVRPTFSQFIQKYKILSDYQMKETVDNCITILKKSFLSGWCIGKSKVFLKFKHVEKLTQMLDERINSVVHMQRVVRGFVQRERYKKMKEKILAAKLEQDKIEAMQANILLGRYTELPSTSVATISKTDNRSVFEVVELQNAKSDESPDVEFLDDIPAPPTPPNSAKFGPADSKLSLKEWFRKTQIHNVRDNQKDKFQDWFHGIISRRDAEKLLANKLIGCFLIRVSESRFGYTLSFKAENRCRHYIIEQLKNRKFIIIGETKIHRSLHDLVSFYKKNKLSNWQNFLTVSCGQNSGECDYSDLIGSQTYFEIENTPPQVPPRSYTAKNNSSWINNTASHQLPAATRKLN
ncbi:myosin-IIIb [Biomphalaria pfeifferi]|uniref:Myosin-IIIb n=1 Tax=Biomphalaria pfeifferi TaxID=112525 RepID=A0AAD8CCV3_BIOPF|nr:myosin-IIIb [Biomphalaria pfeifferi]